LQVTNGVSGPARPSNKEMKLTSVERIGRSQLISSVRRLLARGRPVPYVVSLLILLGCGVAVGASAPKTPEDALVQEIDRRLKTQHVMTAVAELYADAGRWAILLKGIARGHVPLMEAAVRLSPGTDAGASEQIDLAFGDALVNHAETVLRLAPDLGSTCGNIDEAYTTTLRRALAEVSRRLTAVSSVAARDLQGTKARCVTALAGLREALPQGYK
jgi:hypothetical protein